MIALSYIGKADSSGAGCSMLQALGVSSIIDSTCSALGTVYNIEITE